MVDACAIPRLLLIADRFSLPERAEHVVECVRAGVPWVQLRDHGTGADLFEESALLLSDLLRAENPDVLISVNSHVHVAASLGSGTGRPAGVHVGRRGPAVSEVRSRLRADTPVGKSVQELVEIQRSGADYFVWSPVFETQSKPGHPGTGLDALRSARKKAGKTPVLALGGITPRRTAACLEVGAHGVAVLSGLMLANDAARAVQEYLNAIQESVPVP